MKSSNNAHTYSRVTLDISYIVAYSFFDKHNSVNCSSCSVALSCYEAALSHNSHSLKVSISIEGFEVCSSEECLFLRREGML